MSRPLTIALDAMGGDHAPQSVVEGALSALSDVGSLRFIFFGDEKQIEPLIHIHPALTAVSRIIHTTAVVGNNDKPTVVLRSGQETSMWKAIESVAEGKTDCVVSAGNTGALMVLARKHLKMIPGIDRPAIAAAMPTLRGQTVVLDLGANADCAPENLVQFALMGAVYANAVLEIEHPTIGLINVGEEEQKGSELVRKTMPMLRAATLPGEFIGSIEGNDIGKGKVDVAVTDGFTGNVLLKTAEGTAYYITGIFKAMANTSFFSKIALILALPALATLRKKADPRLYNGAMFLGLGGVCVKSHGSMDKKGFANAIKVAANLVTHKFNETVSKDIAERLSQKTETTE